MGFDVGAEKIRGRADIVVEADEKSASGLGEDLVADEGVALLRARDDVERGCGAGGIPRVTGRGLGGGIGAVEADDDLELGMVEILLRDAIEAADEFVGAGERGDEDACEHG